MIPCGLLAQTTLLFDDGLCDEKSNVFTPYGYATQARHSVVNSKCPEPGAIHNRGSEKLGVHLIAARVQNKPDHRFKLH